LTTVHGFSSLHVGDVLTISGVREPDRRWWPRLKAWVLRRPPPMREALKRFKVSEVAGSTMQVKP
jgi:hypothetical protein